MPVTDSNFSKHTFLSFIWSFHTDIILSRTLILWTQRLLKYRYSPVGIPKLKKKKIAKIVAGSNNHVWMENICNYSATQSRFYTKQEGFLVIARFEVIIRVNTTKTVIELEILTPIEAILSLEFSISKCMHVHTNSTTLSD